MEMIFSGVLGVIFHEAVRVYRCIIGGTPIIPSVGLTPNARGFIYFLVILVFILVASTFTHYFAQGNPVAGFLFGIGVPSGTRLIAPVKRTQQAGTEDDQVDDFWSEEAIAKNKRKPIGISKLWLGQYYV